MAEGEKSHKVKGEKGVSHTASKNMRKLLMMRPVRQKASDAPVT